MDHHSSVPIAGPVNPKAGRLMRQAAIASFCVAALLLVTKLAVYLMTGSVALMASLVDSGIDLMASTVNLIAVRQALTPADEDHRFGHGKAEALAGLYQATVILGSAAYLIYESASHVMNPQPVLHGSWGIGVMVLSLVATVGLVMFQRHTVRKSGSLAIEADAAHYVADIAQNVGVMIAIGLSAFAGIGYADPAIGLLIALGIAWTAIGIYRQSFRDLMDHELPDADRDTIKAIAYAHPEVISLHELRTRRAGTQVFIQFHMELPADMSLMAAHEISDEVEHQLMAAFPGAQVLIHQDPAGELEVRRKF